MRIWHTKLIPVLPRQQLLGQWRELNSIFKKQDKHILINFVYDYPKEDLFNYSVRVVNEMQKRGYKVNVENLYEYVKGEHIDYMKEPFAEKMTARYFLQCYYNLQEKYDCGGITAEEWQKIESGVEI